MVFPEDAHLGVLVAERPAVQEEAELDAEGDGDGDDGGEVEGGFAALGEALAGEGDEDERYGHHDEGEVDVAEILDAGLADGVLRCVSLFGGAVTQDQGDVR